MGQLAKQMAKRPTGTFWANTEMNPKEECKVIFTGRESVEKEKRIKEDVSIWAELTRVLETQFGPSLFDCPME